MEMERALADSSFENRVRASCENIFDMKLSVRIKKSRKISSRKGMDFCPRPTFFVATEINPSLRNENFLSKWG